MNIKCVAVYVICILSLQNLTLLSAGVVDLPTIDVSDHLHVMTGDMEMDDESDNYPCKDMDGSLMTGVHQRSKMPVCPGSIIQRLSLPWKKRKYDVRDVASIGNSPVAQARKQHRSMQGRHIDG